MISMTSLMRQAAGAAVATAPRCWAAAPAGLQRRGFHASSASAGHGSHMSDNDPDALQREKERNLTGGRRLAADCLAGMEPMAAPGGDDAHLPAIRPAPLWPA
jgi:hypothetical protein